MNPAPAQIDLSKLPPELASELELCETNLRCINMEANFIQQRSRVLQYEAQDWHRRGNAARERAIACQNPPSGPVANAGGGPGEEQPGGGG